LSLEDGRNVSIQRIETNTYNHYVNVYNFEVKDFHIYYISDVSVLVHNKTPCQQLAQTKKKSARITYMGKTPSKKSKTGRAVIERMKK
ncbi:MAG: hypothetical protein Q606_CBAC00060G0003, partial [Intestinibacter bartlettii DORA_8_9]